MEKQEGPSLGLPAVKELIWGKRPVETTNRCQSPRVLHATLPTHVFYAAFRLPVPRARWQVYEIKVQCPINNLAAYCEKKENTRNIIATISSSLMRTDILNAHHFHLHVFI